MSKIEWTGRTWNPVTGCNKVSQGCKNCYAEVMHRRLQGLYPKKYGKAFLDGPETHEDVLALPLKVKKPTTWFVNSMSDLFHKSVPFEFIAQVFAVMWMTPQHTYQILTKRPERMKEFLADDRVPLMWSAANRFHDRFIKKLEQEIYLENEIRSSFPLENVWLGVSVEDQKAANERIPLLLGTPAAVRFLSCEPLLGSIHLNNIGGTEHRINLITKAAIDRTETTPGLSGWLPLASEINWVIVGGESGHGARPMHPDWVRSIRDQCTEANIPFFFKQWGEWRSIGVGTDEHATEPIKIGKKKAGRFLDGRYWDEMPEMSLKSKVQSSETMILSYSDKRFPKLIEQGIKIHTLRSDPHNRWRPGLSIEHWMHNPRVVK